MFSMIYKNTHFSRKSAIFVSMRHPITLSVKRHALLCMATALLSAALVSCKEFREPEPLPAEPPTPDMAIADLHALCRDRTIVIDSHITIGGYVTSSDAASNFYKTFTIEDASGGAEIMAGITGLHNIYPESYYVTVALNGCAAGEHYGVMQIGLAPDSYDYYPTGYFSARAVIDRYVSRHDIRHAVAPEPVAVGDMTPDMCGRLITIGPVRCVTAERFPDTWQANTDGTWGGYNFFATASDEIMAVYTSAYAAYAYDAIPDGYVALTGILQRGKIGAEEFYMIKMRDETDCTPYD